MYNTGKKAVYCTLMVMLLLSLSSVFVFASENKTITLTGGSVKPGDNITVKVWIDDPQLLAGIQCTITYDSTILEVKEDDIVDGLKGFQTAKNVIEEKSCLKYSAVNTKGIDTTDETVLFSINFRVKSGAANGDTLVKINDVFASTDDLKQISLNKSDAVINIKSSGGSGGGSHSHKNDKDNENTNSEEDTSAEQVPNENKTAADFKDIDNYDWARSSIDFLVQSNILKGTAESTFSPSSNIKRADYMLIIVRMLDLDSKQTSDNFDDVDESKYYYNALAVAKTYGYANGTGDNNFDPEGEITREDLFVLTYRILLDQNIIDSSLENNNVNLNNFKDYNNISEYARGPLSKLFSMGLIKGSNNLINPKGKATRAETAVFVERIYNLLHEQN